MDESPTSSIEKRIGADGKNYPARNAPAKQAVEETAAAVTSGKITPAPVLRHDAPASRPIEHANEVVVAVERTMATKKPARVRRGPTTLETF